MGYNPRSEEQRQTRQLMACIREIQKKKQTQIQIQKKHSHTLNWKKNKQTLQNKIIPKIKISFFPRVLGISC